MNGNAKTAKTVLIVGATGYVGRAVVAEAIKQGYHVIAVARRLEDEHRFAGAQVMLADVTDPASIAQVFNRKIDIVISCLACRSGLARDFDAIDYQATLNILNLAIENGAEKFILLSAICVRKPDLPLQLAKLKMEDALMRSGIDYTIVRPTAYFWVFDVQAKRIKKGVPGFVIGTGDEAVHNPIAREDLAAFLVDSIADTERRNRVFVIGGPEVAGNVVTSRDSLTMIFEILGKEPKIVSVPAWLLAAAIGVTQFAGMFSRRAGVSAELLKIVRYYLSHDMRAPGYGSITLRQHLLDTIGEKNA